MTWKLLLKDRVVLVLLTVTGPNALGAWLWQNFGVEFAATGIWFLIGGLATIVLIDAWLSRKERQAAKRRQRKQIQYIEGNYDYVR